MAGRAQARVQKKQDRVSLRRVYFISFQEQVLFVVL
jgi:hypothetical protein